jgi:hypothetical protein
VERMDTTSEEDALEVKVDGRTIKVVTRPPGGDGGRLFELGPSVTWSDDTPLTDEDVAGVVRGLIKTSRKDGQPVSIVGVSRGAAEQFPGDARISVMPLDPLSFSLPGSPTGLALHMDERGDGRVEAIGNGRVNLGADGMWWIVTRLIEALEDPETVSEWPRFLTLGDKLGGPATQATLEATERGVRVVWSHLQSGIVGDVVAVQELSSERAKGWLTLLRPVRDALESCRAHRQRMRPARTAERWARVLERWQS